MATFLLVSGNGCFGALAFERSEWFDKKSQIVQECKANGWYFEVELEQAFCDDDVLYFQLFEFSDCVVTPEFMKFIHSQVMDYDRSKECNIYLVD